MGDFDFSLDEKSRDYCNLILDYMVQNMSLTREAALIRMNALWRGLSFIGTGDLIYHEDIDYWAKIIAETTENRK